MAGGERQCHGGRQGQGHSGRQGQGQGHGGHLDRDFGRDARAVIHPTRVEILKGRFFFPPHVILMGKWVKKRLRIPIIYLL